MTVSDVKIIYQALFGDGLRTVCGDSVRLPYTDASFGVHAEHDDYGRIRGWTVTHLLSGSTVGTGRTKDAAFLDAVAYVRRNKRRLFSMFAAASQARVRLNRMEGS
ncbi:hypothetical protein ADU20_28145 [Burkholderia pseudomallei]|nr:hypothetical protein BGI50_17990 [Burkholderia pseudomallei]KNA30978.1 hypothetical protein ADU20_28145 [Burkholderia pseudomallei]OMO10720.1 hypothetical protein BGI48_18135 [Burkholderia pseudomallei]OMT91447.1 hypothetical protein AQ766_08725 [Burkholderia pseudomallei]